jgi:cytochrome c553
MKQAQEIDDADSFGQCPDEVYKALQLLFDKGILGSGNTMMQMMEMLKKCQDQKIKELEAMTPEQINNPPDAEEKDDAGFGEAMRGMLPPQGA